MPSNGNGGDEGEGNGEFGKLAEIAAETNLATGVAELQGEVVHFFDREDGRLHGASRRRLDRRRPGRLDQGARG